MSYKKEIEQMRLAVEGRKKLIFNLIKITSVLLALSLCVMTVALCVFLLADEEPPSGRVDRKAPVFTFNGPDEYVIYATLGETVSYRQYVSASDNSGSCSLTFDNSKVDITREGIYTVTCTATDDAGNSSSCEIKVVIKKAEFSYDSLMSKISDLCARLGITKTMSKEEQVKAVFNFVNTPDKPNKNDANIVFSNESNSARDNWQTDWVEEAYLTLQSMSGDCYSYYAVSKAFFEYLGIDSMSIQRDPSETRQDGTHFWMIVNIGGDNGARWYYYDATRLLHKFPNGQSGCLFTKAQLDNYNNNIYPGFYTHSAKGLPTIATEEIIK